MNYVGRVGIVLACIMVSPATHAFSFQVAGRVLPIYVDYDEPPAQLDEFIARVDAVAVVRVEWLRFASAVEPQTGRARDVTNYDLRVLEVLKAHGMLPPSGGAFTLTRVGGQHTEQGTVVRSAVQGFEEFQKGGEYVLFLTWNNGTNTFDIAYGPDGSYQLLASGTVRPLGRSDVAKKQQNKERAAFLRDVRAASIR